MKQLCAAILLLSFAGHAHAADKGGAEAALAGAEQAEAMAAKLGNRWVPAEAALKASRAALATQNWDTALAEATKARALALRAVEQSHEQETAWHDAVIR
jgi:hypothetical protein